jgi:hypothetical protein
MKLKELLKVTELDVTLLMKIKGGYALQVLDCGGDLCKDLGCSSSAKTACDSKDCAGNTCTTHQCFSNAA